MPLLGDLNRARCTGEINILLQLIRIMLVMIPCPRLPINLRRFELMTSTSQNSMLPKEWCYENVLVGIIPRETEALR